MSHDLFVDACNDYDNENENDNDTAFQSTCPLGPAYSPQFLAVPTAEKKGILASLLNSVSLTLEDVRKLTTLHFGITSYVSKGKRKAL